LTSWWAPVSDNSVFSDSCVKDFISGQISVSSTLQSLSKLSGVGHVSVVNTSPFRILLPVHVLLQYWVLPCQVIHC
jgi:hypothetical protein